MNRKTITKILTRKHNDFLSSIEDKDVRDIIDKNGIITGGSIASMLLNEKISDYDYYFRTKEAVIKVAKYYIDRFTGLNPDNIIKPSLLYDDEPNGRVKLVVKSAGITSENGDQGYQYFENYPDEVGQEYVEKVIGDADEISIEPIDDIKPKYRPVFMSSNAITLSNSVQLVIRFYGEPDDIHENYDFIHCCNYWTSWDKKLTLNSDALESLLTKNLYYQGSLYPVCSIIRLRKFIKRGWYVNAGQMLKIMFQISELDLTDIPTLEEQLTGVDAAYFHQVIDYCKEKQEKDKDFKLTTPYLISIVEKIFG